MSKKCSPDRKNYFVQQDIPQQHGNDSSMNFDDYEDEKFIKQPKINLKEKLKQRLYQEYIRQQSQNSFDTSSNASSLKHKQQVNNVSLTDSSMFSDFGVQQKNPRVVNISPHLQNLKKESPKIAQPQDRQKQYINNFNQNQIILTSTNNLHNISDISFNNQSNMSIINTITELEGKLQHQFKNQNNENQYENNIGKPPLSGMRSKPQINRNLILQQNKMKLIQEKNQQNKNGQRHYLQPPNNISSNQSSIDESKIESNVSESQIIGQKKQNRPMLNRSNSISNHDFSKSNSISVNKSKISYSQERLSSSVSQSLVSEDSEKDSKANSKSKQINPRKKSILSSMKSSTSKIQKSQIIGFKYSNYKVNQNSKIEETIEEDSFQSQNNDSNKLNGQSNPKSEDEYKKLQAKEALKKKIKELEQQQNKKQPTEKINPVNKFFMNIFGICGAGKQDTNEKKQNEQEKEKVLETRSSVVTIQNLNKSVQQQKKIDPFKKAIEERKKKREIRLSKQDSDSDSSSSYYSEESDDKKNRYKIETFQDRQKYIQQSDVDSSESSSSENEQIHTKLKFDKKTLNQKGADQYRTNKQKQNFNITEDSFDKFQYIEKDIQQKKEQKQQKPYIKLQSQHQKSINYDKQDDQQFSQKSKSQKKLSLNIQNPQNTFSNTQMGSAKTKKHVTILTQESEELIKKTDSDICMNESGELSFLQKY